MLEVLGPLRSFADLQDFPLSSETLQDFPLSSGFFSGEASFLSEVWTDKLTAT